MIIGIIITLDAHKFHLKTLYQFANRTEYLKARALNLNLIDM